MYGDHHNYECDVGCPVVQVDSNLYELYHHTWNKMLSVKLMNYIQDVSEDHFVITKQFSEVN